MFSAIRTNRPIVVAVAGFIASGAILGAVALVWPAPAGLPVGDRGARLETVEAMQMGLLTSFTLPWWVFAVACVLAAGIILLLIMATVAVVGFVHGPSSQPRHKLVELPPAPVAVAVPITVGS